MLPSPVRATPTCTFFACLVLAGCGGGGGGDSQPPPAPQNRAPTANAGADQAVTEGTSVTLDASASTDTDGTIASYAWTQTDGAAVTLSGGDTSMASFDTPLTDTQYELEFEVTVTDDDGATAIAATTVTVNPSQAPVADAGTDFDVTETESVALAGSGTDAEGPITAYAWTQLSGPAVALADADTDAPAFDAPVVADVTVLEFELTVTDSTEDEGSDTVTVTVYPNIPPVADAGADIEVVETDPVTLAGSGNDADGTVTGFAWVQTAGPAVALNGADTATATFTAPTVAVIANLEFQLTVIDNLMDAGSDAVTIVVNPNEPPELAVHFPCAGCRHYGAPLAATGAATAGADNAFVAPLDGVQNVNVSTGSPATNAMIQDDGKWIAQNVPLNVVNDNVQVVINATDKFGETSSEAFTMPSAPTFVSLLYAPVPGAPGHGFVYETGNSAERLFNVEFSSGSYTRIRQSVTEFDAPAVGGLVVDPAGTRVYVNETAGAIVAIDSTSGDRSILSDDVTGSGPAFDTPDLLAIDADDNRLVIFDSGLSALLVVDLATGNRTIAADNVSVGIGPAFDSILDIAVDAANDVAYVEEAPDDYLAVNLATGDRSLLPESGETIGSSTYIDYDPARGRLAAVDSFNGNVYTIDTTTGVRLLLSNNAADPPWSMGRPRQLVVDTELDRYVINDFGAAITGEDSDRLVAIDPDSGDRSLAYADSRGSGPTPEGGATLALDAGAGLLYVASSVSNNVIVVDIATGDRQLLSSNAVGSGPMFETPRDIVLDEDNDRLLVVDAMSGLLLAVDRQNGNRYTVSGGLVGAGTAFSTPVAVEPDYDNGRVFIIDEGLAAVVEVELASGNRTVLSDNSDSGPTLIETGGLALDSANGRLLATENQGGATIDTRVLGIDLVTGDRVEVSGEATGGGPLLDLLHDVVLLDGGDFAVVSGGSRFYLVALASGDRQLLTSATAGIGETMRNSPSIAYDPERDVFYTWSTNHDAVFQVDVFTGARVTVSK